MEIELFEHNEIAYQKLKAHLENNQMASIDHATGTGKSFIALKYLYQNKDKRILYLTPTYYIFNQLVDVHMKKLNIDKNEFKTLDNMIYSNLLRKNMDEIALKYDLIVFDEYHRCGAKEWGIKVKELVEIIKEKYSEKKIIGLTATPTRYLDNERDMNEELFSGESVSTLTLGDAILRGLLQPPTYINTARSYIEYLEHIKKKLKRKFVYQEDIEEYQKLIDSVTEKIKNDIELKINNDIELPRENGKYIVFCSKISEIEKNKQLIKDMFKEENMSFYSVHSGQKKQKNENELEKFRRNNDSSSFIFVVDILNEGIHVDNIDGIFLLRKTNSPIIYFQQLGRLLSYSTNQKKLMVWDMVDNIKNHKVIYKLYQDVISKAKKNLLEEPEKSELYDRIISNFKIVDNYTDVMSKISFVEEKIDKISEIELLKMRVSRFVTILCDQYRNNSTLSRKKQIEQLFKANEDLYKYYKYINLEQFDRLKKVNIKLPSEINVSHEEFKNKLSGYNTLYDKEFNEQLKVFNNFRYFVNKNDRLPSILSSDVREQEYAYSISNIILKCDNKIKKMYFDLINNISYVNPFDKYYYLQNNEKIDYNLFFKSLDYCVDNDIPINKNICMLFVRLYSQPTLKEKYNLDKYFNKLKYRYNIQKDTKISFANESYIDEKQELEFDAQKLSKLKKYGLQSLIIEDVKKFVKDYIEELISFLEINGRYPNSSDLNEYEKYCSFRPFINEFGFKNILEQKLNTNKDIEFELFMEELSDFMINNNGDYPSDRVLDNSEILLAKKVKKNIKKLQYYKFKLDELQKNIRSKNNDNWFWEYVSFISEKRRYPVIQSDDIMEKNLMIRYLRNENNLSMDERKKIKVVVNGISESEIIKNTFLERQKVRSKK